MRRNKSSTNKSDSTIDLSIDQNNNQISDAVENLVALLPTLPEEQQKEEIENFCAKLPYSPETIALQEQAQEVDDKLAAAKTPEEAQLILDEFVKLTLQIKEDPVIAKVSSDLFSLTGIGRVSSNQSGTPVNFAALRKGDILARHSWFGFIFPWSMEYEHTGNFRSNNLVYESNLVDGVNLRDLQEWRDPGQYVGHARNKRVTAAKMATAMDWALNKYGINGKTPYNWWNFPNKWMDNALYCSQLTWKINKYIGYDLDSNHWYYHLVMSIVYTPAVLAIIIPAVAPDEVMLSSHVNVLSAGWT